MSYEQNRRIIYIALGSNATDSPIKSAQLLRSAVLQITLVIGNIYKSSNIFQTPCFPRGAGPDFANSVVAVETDLPVADVLERLHQIEAEFGRERLVRWGQRTLDLDLLADGDLVLPDRSTFLEWKDLPLSQQLSKAPDQLILPHPRIQDRAFVLVPWAEIEGGWLHPVLGKTVMEMCAALSDEDRAEVRPIPGEAAEK